MRSFRLVPILFICFSSQIYAQGGLFWNQYAAGNPAATGVNSALDVSSVTSLYGKSIIRERINADLRVKKLHGAVGIGYRYIKYGMNYQANNPYLNYSFHWKIGENSLLAFGAGVNFETGRYNYGPGFNSTFSVTTFGLGVHYQYKRLKIGASLTTLDNSSQKIVINDAYVDYTFNLGENWQLNAAAHAGHSDNFENSVMARAIYKNKFWFGASYGQHRRYGIMAGINLNDHWSVGYSIEARNSGYDGFSIASNNLMIRFQLPGK